MVWWRGYTKNAEQRGEGGGLSSIKNREGRVRRNDKDWGSKG